MFRNYLTVALRNIVRHRLYSFINIAGLAVGLACVIFVILFVRDQLSYDTWIPDTQNLYRLELTILPPDRPPLETATIPYDMPKTMRDEIPGVTGQSVLGVENMSLVTGNKQFVENVDVVDPNFFTLIKLPFVMGDPATAFRQPQSLVLTQSAMQLEDLIGKCLVNGGPKGGNGGGTAPAATTAPPKSQPKPAASGG